jgi:hypothetical protein
MIPLVTAALTCSRGEDLNPFETRTNRIVSFPPVLEFFGRGKRVLILKGCELILVLLSVFQVRSEIPFCDGFMAQANVLLVLIEAFWDELRKAKLARHKIRKIPNQPIIFRSCAYSTR